MNFRRCAGARSLLFVGALACAGSVSAGTLLVGNKGEDTVSFIDLDSGAERARVSTGHAPHEIAISPDHRQAAVVAYGGTTVDIFDVASTKLVRRVDIAPNAAPHGIVWLRDGRIVMAAEKSRSVVILHPADGSIEAIPTDQKGSHMIVVSPDARFAYVSNILSGTVSIIDLRRKSKIGDIMVGGNPEGIAITPNGRELWVGDDVAPHVRVVAVRTRKVVATLDTDSIAIRVAITPDGKTAITSNFAAGTLNLFDVATKKAAGTISVSGEKSALQVTMAFARKPSRLYVAETGRNRVAEVDLGSRTVVRRLAAGRNGDGLAVAP